MDQFSTPTWDDVLNDRLLSRRRRNREERSEVRNRVAALKAQSGCNRFPSDVQALARSVGIRQVRSLPLAMRGRIVREGTGIIAELNEMLPPREQRFVLAHEIAHILLARDLDSAGARSVFGPTTSQKSYRYVEQLCDYAAREILLPENAIRKELKLRPLSLEMAVAMAEEADCDLQVVAQCICDLPGQQDLIFLFCRSNAESVDVLKVVPNSSMTYELGDKGDSLVRRALREKKEIKGDQEVWANGSRAIVAAQALRVDSGDVIVLIGVSNG